MAEKEQSRAADPLDKCNGKTIADWEFGTVGLGPQYLTAQRFMLHFTDGSKLTIDVGSDASSILLGPEKGMPGFYIELIVRYKNPGEK